MQFILGPIPEEGISFTQAMGLVSLMRVKQVIEKAFPEGLEFGKKDEKCTFEACVCFNRHNYKATEEYINKTLRSVQETPNITTAVAELTHVVNLFYVVVKLNKARAEIAFLEVLRLAQSVEATINLLLTKFEAPSQELLLLADEIKEVVRLLL